MELAISWIWIYAGLLGSLSVRVVGAYQGSKFGAIKQEPASNNYPILALMPILPWNLELTIVSYFRSMRNVNDGYGVCGAG